MITEVQPTVLPVLTRCSECGLTSPMTEVFRRGRRRGSLICPGCQLEGERRSVQHWLIGLAALIGLGVLVVALGKESNPGWGLLNLALMMIMMWLVIVPHELGHALTARLCGLPVIRMIMGSGRQIFTAKLFGITTDFHALPREGWTYLALRSVPWLQVRLFCVYSAGVLVNAAMLFLAIHFGEPFWLAERVESGLAPVCVFITANFLVIVLNLFPWQTMKGPNDGAQMLTVLFKRMPDLSQAEIATRYMRIHSLAADRKFAAMVEQCRLALLDHPGDENFSGMLGSGLLLLDRYQEALDVLVPLSKQRLSLSNEATAANNIAWAKVMLQKADESEEILALATRAHELAPWGAHIKSTLGCAHAFYGDANTAVSLLTSKHVMSNPLPTKAYSLCGLGLAHARLGEHDKSTECLSLADRIDGQCKLRRIVDVAVGSAAIKPEHR